MKDAYDYSGKEIGIEGPYINMGLGIRNNDEDVLHHARVKRKSLYDGRNHMGTPSKNFLLYHQQHKVELMDSRIEILTVNIIAENLLAQIYDDGH